MSDNITIFGPKVPLGLVLATLLVGAVVTLILWTALTKKGDAIVPPSVKLKCYRIQMIPNSMTKDKLQTQLIEYIQRSEAQNLDYLKLTLARSSSEHHTATLMLYKPLKILGYSFDTNFIGITPLFEGNNSVVE